MVSYPQIKKFFTASLTPLLLLSLGACQRAPLPLTQQNNFASFQQNRFRAMNAGLKNIKEFGSNPGNLEMWQYTPQNIKANAPLVVALHGCTMTPQSYDNETGWTQWAEQMGFSLLLPGQKKSNNQYNCFNWGGDPNSSQKNMDSCDTERDCGEAKSIKEMIDHISIANQVDPRRIYITGLSAGGAYTNVMLSAYPDVFAGGGIIAGLPYQCNLTADGRLDSNQAFMCMSMGQNNSPQAWAERVIQNNGFNEPQGLRWPTVQIWHGSRDFTVRPVNADELMKQWTGLHHIDQKAEIQRNENGYSYQAYANAAGETVVESFLIENMGHGVPIDQDGSGGPACGSKGSYMQETHVCASYQMAKRWQLDAPPLPNNNLNAQSFFQATGRIRR